MAHGSTIKDLSEKLKDYFPFLENLQRLLSSKINETLDLVGFTAARLKDSHPIVKKFVGFTEKRVTEALPHVKSFLGFSAEKIKEHPYVFGLVVLIVLWNAPPIPRKMMKAPGSDYLMARDDFELSPRSYFLDLRGKKRRRRCLTGRVYKNIKRHPYLLGLAVMIVWWIAARKDLESPEKRLPMLRNDFDF
ncbi:uncharacterized protein LOC122649812 [Telopea speciosissima]|uniref:uncharacterized protein LOC122649812 n=1 Tax=Telopea speciosissima TaxID=54955 RepID=UPI001CC5D5B8|nr:uncharacterized protein LOC122649812 [Telopea speciosissima]